METSKDTKTSVDGGDHDDDLRSLESSPTASSPRSSMNANVAAASSMPQQQLFNSANTEDDSRRQHVLKEAERVLETIGGQNVLDGFHLLGVVADPRGPGSQFANTTASSANASTTNSYHGRYEESSGAMANNIFGATGASYYQSIESTFSSMTGHMEALNHVLEDWSRQILEDGDGSGAADGDLPESQLKELPEELQNLDMGSLKDYLAQSGPKAASFEQILRHDGEEFDKNNTESRTLTSAINDGSSNTEEKAKKEEQVDVSEIPKIFFDPDFDLTDPRTFGKLLLAASSSEEETVGVLKVNPSEGPVHEWFPLQPQDAMSGHLDKIELALLLQVRANSGKFFAESQRFAQLQEWIQNLLEQVVRLQTTTSHLQTDLLQPMETVPIADTQRTDLKRLELVLEKAEDMLLCKHGLGGVLSAQDDLTAIEQIQYGRRLLDGSLPQHHDDDDDYEEEMVVELGKLHSFKAVSEQLNQYEQLVVSNLRDELVEMFLNWNSGSSVYAGGGSSISNKGIQQEQFHARVREIAGALKHCGALSRARDAYGTRLQDTMRMTVRTTVGEFAADVAPEGAVQSVAMGASSMTLGRFLDCLDMLFEQLLALLTSVSNVNEFFVSEGIYFDNDAGENSSSEKKSPSEATASPPTPLATIMVSTSELASKSIAELLRLRKDAHSLVTLEEMKSIWDVCNTFAEQVEKISGNVHTSTLRSTLLAQVKAFVERRHESNMSSLAAALDSERWVQCEVSNERQAVLSRLCLGRPILVSSSKHGGTSDPGAVQKSPDIEAEGTRYKVVWSCLLLVEMILNHIATAAHFSNLASVCVNKVSELLRLFNTRTTQLVLGAGAIHSHAKLKSINAKHLSLVTQCLGMVVAILPHIRAALMAQLPKKQHTLLNGLDQIKKEYTDHNEKVLNKFVSIIGGIVEHGLSKKIAGTDFDRRAESGQAADGTVACCVFLEGVSTNTRKMHQVLNSLLPPDHLIDTFSRIFAYIDTKVPALLIAAADSQSVFQKQDTNSSKTNQTRGPRFSFPKTDEGKRQLLLEVESMTKNLNSLEGVRAWDFTATNVLERTLEYTLSGGPTAATIADEEGETPEIADEAEDSRPISAEVEDPQDNAQNGEHVGEDPTIKNSVDAVQGSSAGELPEEGSPQRSGNESSDAENAEAAGEMTKVVTEDEESPSMVGASSSDGSSAPEHQEEEKAVVQNGQSQDNTQPVDST